MPLQENNIAGEERLPVSNLNDFFFEKETDGDKELALVKRIEALDVYDSERLNLVMAWQGLVPTANFIISATNPPRTEKEQNELCLKVEKLFTDLGLKFKEKTDYPGREGGRRFYQVAKSEEILNEFIGIDFSDRKNSERIGLMFGVPQTAAAAYAKGTKFLIRDEDMPAKIRAEEYMTFSKFWFSREHWQEELETVKKWAREIKRINPALYERLVAYHKVFPFPLFKIGHITTEDIPYVSDLKYIK